MAPVALQIESICSLLWCFQIPCTVIGSSLFITPKTLVCHVFKYSSMVQDEEQQKIFSNKWQILVKDMSCFYMLFCFCSCRERKCTTQEWEDIKRPSIKLAPLFSICDQCTKIVVTPSQSLCRRCHGSTVIPFLKEDFSPIKLLFPGSLSPLNASNRKDLSDLLPLHCRKLCI